MMPDMRYPCLILEEGFASVDVLGERADDNEAALFKRAWKDDITYFYESCSLQSLSIHEKVYDN